MTIDPTTSILSLAEGRDYYFEFKSDTSGTWTLDSGTIPDGMTFEEIDGFTAAIHGTPSLESEGSIYKPVIKCDDGAAGIDTLQLYIGVTFAEQDDESGPSWTLDLLSGEMSFAGVSERDEKTGLAVVRMKRGDTFLVELILDKAGIAQDRDVYRISLWAKQFESEAVVDLTGPGILMKKGGGAGSTRHVFQVDLTPAKLSQFLANGSESDLETFAPLVAELEVEFYENAGVAEPVEATRTSNHFLIRLSRDLG